MAITILTTKLHSPTLRPEQVRRPRLLEKLVTGYRGGCKLTLLCAPAGSGKTTLAAEWLHALQSAPADPLPSKTAQNQTPEPSTIGPIKIAWLLLDAGDNDLVVFLSYLVAALQRIDASIGVSVQPMLESSRIPPIEKIIPALANDLAAVSEKFILVLDDLHTIHDVSVQKALTQLLENQPPQMHVAITTRQDPLLPISRWRARGQVNEIRLGDLRFTEEEAGRFLNQGMGLSLSTDEIAILDARTEGWIAGLQLAAITLQQDRTATSPLDLIRSFSGSDRFVTDYLIDEVLSHQSMEVQAFLLKTSILERMCAPLCDALLSGPPAEADQPLAQNPSAQSILDLLDRANLFLVPLDHHREWYRYHHLFAQLLRARLQSQYGEQFQNALHRSAAHWFAEKNLIHEAVEHAAAAKDYDWLADLLESRLKRPATWSHGEVNQYLAWLNRLPASILEARPSLCMDTARCLHIAGNTQEGREWLEKAERSLSAWPPSEEKQHLRGIIAANWATFLVMSGEDHRAVKAAEEALTYLPEKDALWRMRAMHAQALANDELGDSERSLQIYEQAIRLARQTNNTFLDLSTTGNLAYVFVRRGALRQAAQVCQQALEAAESQGKATPAVSLPKIAMGGIQFERNQLAEAENTLQAGLDLAERGGIGLVVKNSGVLATIAWVRLARGNRSGAQQTLDQMDELFAYSSHQWLRQRLNQEAVRAHLALALGDVRHAMDWARAYEQMGPTEFTREVPDIVLARVYLAEEQPGRAQGLLERLLSDALQRGQNRAAIEITILLAVTLTRLKKPEAARSAIFKAVELAAPEGFVRLFVAEGEPMRELMEEARRQAKPGVETGFIEQVLAALPKSDPMSPVERANHALVEPLTEREQEVLRYLSVGLTLSEIAQKLYLSPNTLKAHTNNIYSKLDAHSRLQAVTKAHDLGLLG